MNLFLKAAPTISYSGDPPLVDNSAAGGAYGKLRNYGVPAVPIRPQEFGDTQKNSYYCRVSKPCFICPHCPRCPPRKMTMSVKFRRCVPRTEAPLACPPRCLRA